MEKKERSFEQLMKQLEEIVTKIESEEVGLDESISLYEEGLKLSEELKKQLNGFEERIAGLNKDE